MTFSNSNGQQNFFETYPDALTNVNAAYDQCNEIKLYSTKPHISRFIFSIAAPEVSIYNEFMDKMESAAAEVFYINLGEPYGNFSLGLFQMKPSFIEKLEKDINSKCPECKYQKALLYDCTTATEQRATRIARLKDHHWQEIYLISFYELMEKRYGAHSFKSLSEQLEFYATAYNFGFDRLRKEIISRQSKHSFPGRFSSVQFAYAQISIQIFEKLSIGESEHLSRSVIIDP